METSLKSYQTTAQIDDELIVVDKYRYIPGEPKNYRFNAQTGQFNIDGEIPLVDKKGKPVETFTFQPVAFRIFEENLFGRDGRGPWAEVFFVDAQQCVSAIMFNGTTLDELRQTMKKLFYASDAPLQLTDVVLTVKPERISSKSDPGKSWFIGRFSFEVADPAEVSALREFAKDRSIYRRDTLTPTAVYVAYSDTFRLPSVADAPPALPPADAESIAEVEPETLPY